MQTSFVCDAKSMEDAECEDPEQDAGAPHFLSSLLCVAETRCRALGQNAGVQNKMSQSYTRMFVEYE